MHAQDIVQDLLDAECPQIHAKRRRCLAVMAEAARDGELTLLGMSRFLPQGTSIRHRIKRCDRWMGNEKLNDEILPIYAAMARRVIAPSSQPAIIVDWSDLRADQSRHLRGTGRGRAWHGNTDQRHAVHSPKCLSSLVLAHGHGLAVDTLCDSRVGALAA